MKRLKPSSAEVKHLSRRKVLASGLSAIAATAVINGNDLLKAAEPAADSDTKPELTIGIMDPLAAPLACDCVKGYANRQYLRLAEWLETSLDVKSQVYFSNSLADLKDKKSTVRCDLVIGKFSVVEHQSKAIGQSLKPVASLTDSEGHTTQRGLFAVRSDCAAATLLDLNGAVFYLGSDDCDEKWAAPRQLIEQMEIEMADESKSFASCSEAAKALLELPKETLACAVISSYAAPLLEGCGTIKRGDLKIIGQTDELPFITAFVNDQLPSTVREAIAKALCQPMSSELKQLLETEKGFLPYVASV